MSRYSNSTVLAPLNEPRHKSTVIFPIVDTNLQQDIYIRTTAIERLDKLAADFYGDARNWWMIATANGIGKGTMIVPPNTRLRIPPVETITALTTKINSTR